MRFFDLSTQIWVRAVTLTALVGAIGYAIAPDTPIPQTETASVLGFSVEGVASHNSAHPCAMTPRGCDKGGSR